MCRTVKDEELDLSREATAVLLTERNSPFLELHNSIKRLSGFPGHTELLIREVRSEVKSL